MNNERQKSSTRQKKEMSVMNENDAVERELGEKILKLQAYYELEDSLSWIRLLTAQIELCDFQIEHISKAKPFKFQKKKFKKYEEELQMWEDKKEKSMAELEEEIILADKIYKLHAKEEDDEENDDEEEFEDIEKNE